MFKKDITYTTYDGERVTETFHFHLAKNEIVQMEARYEGGLQGLIRRIGLTKDMKQVLHEMERIVLECVGEKSADGRRFVKSDEIRDAFKQSPAYDELFMELLTQEDAAANFILGALPADVAGEVKASAPLPVPNIQPVVKDETKAKDVPPPPRQTSGEPGVHI